MKRKDSSVAATPAVYQLAVDYLGYRPTRS